MLKLLKEFWYEEDGLGTVEIIVIIVILLGIAFLFRDTINDFVQKLLGQITKSGNELDEINTNPGPAQPQ